MGKELSRSLIILAADSRSFLPVEKYLANRDWIVTTTTDEKTALNLLVERRPSFFMISVDHPNKKVRSLHKLLKQTFPDLCVLLFGEKNNMETYRTLMQSEHPYRIMPPVTGPAVERAVSRFLKEDHERQLQERIYSRSMRRSRDGDAASLSWAPLPEDGADSLLSRGAGRILEEIVEKGDGTVKERLDAGPITNTACIVIESVRFSGYLIAAMAGDRPFDEPFVRLIRDRLVRFLRENGETVTDGESFPMKIREVRFEAWAADYAEFLKKTAHKGQEMVFAFFPATDVAAQIGASPFEDMCCVRLEDIAPDQEVDFNVHLFLPANQKFLLYTPKGAVFQAAQKERLLKSGIRELHIRNDDLPAFRRYLAGQRVDRLIRDYEERAKPAI